MNLAEVVEQLSRRPTAPGSAGLLREDAAVTEPAGSADDKDAEAGTRAALHDEAVVALNRGAEIRGHYTVRAEALVQQALTEMQEATDRVNVSTSSCVWEALASLEESVSFNVTVFLRDLLDSTALPSGSGGTGGSGRVSLRTMLHHASTLAGLRRILAEALKAIVDAREATLQAIRQQLPSPTPSLVHKQVSVWLEDGDCQSRVLER